MLRTRATATAREHNEAEKKEEKVVATRSRSRSQTRSPTKEGKQEKKEKKEKKESKKEKKESKKEKKKSTKKGKKEKKKSTKKGKKEKKKSKKEEDEEDEEDEEESGNDTRFPRDAKNKSAVNRAKQRKQQERKRVIKSNTKRTLTKTLESPVLIEVRLRLLQQLPSSVIIPYLRTPENDSTKQDGATKQLNENVTNALLDTIPVFFDLIGDIQSWRNSPFIVMTLVVNSHGVAAASAADEPITKWARTYLQEHFVGEENKSESMIGENKLFYDNYSDRVYRGRSSSSFSSASSYSKKKGWHTPVQITHNVIEPKKAPRRQHDDDEEEEEEEEEEEGGEVEGEGDEEEDEEDA